MPVFLTYVLSFVYLGIYWNNHHHMLHAATPVNGAVLWANLHLLFWLSLVPFATAWMGENHVAPLPTAVYGMVLSAPGGARSPPGRSSPCRSASSLATAFGRDLKGKLSLVLYVVAIPPAFVHQWIADAIYVVVALMWLVPDRRIEGDSSRAAL